MKSVFVITAVSSQSLSTVFQTELQKIIFEANLIIEKQNTSHGHSLYLQVNAERANIELLKDSLSTLSSLHQVDIMMVPHNVFHARKGLVVFDMDSTLITAEVIDEMAMRHGVGEQVKLITKKAMNGELNFDQSLSERVSLLKGFHRSHMEDILKGLIFTPGTQDFINVLRTMGIKTAIASGGFQYFANSLKDQLQMDYVFANDLEFTGDLLTGKMTGPIINAEAKEQIVIDLALKENLALEQVVAIGDGANDIPMLLRAGLGIAIHAKEQVQKMANYKLNFGPMTNILSFMQHEAL